MGLEGPAGEGQEVEGFGGGSGGLGQRLRLPRSVNSFVSFWQLVWFQSVGFVTIRAHVKCSVYILGMSFLWRSCGSAADPMESWSRAMPTVRLGAVCKVGQCCYPEWAYVGGFVQFWTLISWR